MHLGLFLALALWRWVPGGSLVWRPVRSLQHVIVSLRFLYPGGHVQSPSIRIAPLSFFVSLAFCRCRSLLLLALFLSIQAFLAVPPVFSPATFLCCTRIPLCTILCVTPSL